MLFGLCFLKFKKANSCVCLIANLGRRRKTGKTGRSCGSDFGNCGFQSNFEILEILKILTDQRCFGAILSPLPSSTIL